MILDFWYNICIKRVECDYAEVKDEIKLWPDN